MSTCKIRKETRLTGLKRLNQIPLHRMTSFLSTINCENTEGSCLFNLEHYKLSLHSRSAGHLNCKAYPWKSSWLHKNEWMMKTHTLVLPVLLLTVHFLSRSALQQQLQIMHTNRKTVHGEILPETWNPRFLTLSLQSSLLHSCSRAGVTWRLRGVEQADAVQSVTRLLMLRH